MSARAKRVCGGCALWTSSEVEKRLLRCHVYEDRTRTRTNALRQVPSLYRTPWSYFSTERLCRGFKPGLLYSQTDGRISKVVDGVDMVQQPLISIGDHEDAVEALEH